MESIEIRRFYMKTSYNFIEQYHSTVIEALGEDAKKVNAKIGSIMADRWINNTGKFNNNTEFAQSFENYLKGLQFSDYVSINCDEKDYVLNIKGCIICHGNEILRKKGIATACPIIQTAKYAAVKKIERNIITKGVDKPGIVGECTIRLGLE